MYKIVTNVSGRETSKSMHAHDYSVAELAGKTSMFKYDALLM